MGRDVAASVQVDKGTDYFGDFKFRFKFEGTTAGISTYSAPILLCNIANATANDALLAAEGLYLRFSTNSSQLLTMAIRDFDGNIEDQYNSPSTGTVYYIEMERAGTTITAKFYSDANFTTLTDSLSITASSVAYRYLGFGSGEFAAGTGQTGYIENLEILDP